MPIRIAMVEDDAPFARMLREHFELTPRVVCEAVFPDAESALKDLPSVNPEVLLVDINLPSMNGIEFVTRVAEALPSAVCLMLTTCEEGDVLFNALKAGAIGYLLKRTSPAEIINAIEEARAGGSPMSPQIAKHVVSFFQKGAPAQKEKEALVGEDLADREREVLEHLSQGLLYKEIAETMNISTHTVNSHIRRIYEKLHVHSRGQAVAKYRGLTL